MKAKIFLSATLLLLTASLNTPVYAQTPAQTPFDAAPSTNLDPEKVNNIKKLLQVTGASNLSKQILVQFIDVFKTQYPNVPQKFWNDFITEVHPDEMINELIPIYSKYYTNDDIKQLIAFYQTPIGRKTISILPQIAHDSAAIGQKYGMEAAKRVIEKMKAEGYIH